MHQTPRLKLDVPDGPDLVSAYPPDVTEAYGILDNAVTFLEGTISARAAVPHLAGQVYYATDLGQFFDDDGTNWNLRPVGQSGSSIIATSQSTSSTSYTTLGTPDQVTGLILPASGLIEVLYQATWQATTPSTARAAIFIGSNQLKVAAGDTGGASTNNVVQEAIILGSANVGVPLGTFTMGLASYGGGGAYSGDVTTGQAIGAFAYNSSLGPTGTAVLPTAPGGEACRIFAAAGTYTVSVRFRETSGTATVTASHRRLYARVVPF